MRSIVDIECFCICGWTGTIATCEPDEDGCLCCPVCMIEAFAVDEEVSRN